MGEYARGVLLSNSQRLATVVTTALVLRFGSLPVELTPQESRTVSSTLGEDVDPAVGDIVGIILPWASDESFNSQGEVDITQTETHFSVSIPLLELENEA